MTTSALRDLVIRHPGQLDKQPFLEVVDLQACTSRPMTDW